MKFSIAVLQHDGRIVDCREMSLAQLQCDAIARQAIADFREMLDKHLEEDRYGTFEFQQPMFQDRRGLPKWRHSNLFFAKADFLLFGKVSFTWLYFSGIEPAADALAVREMGKAMTQLTANEAADAADAVGSLTQRPLAVCVPRPPPAGNVERDCAANLGILLGAAFFAKGIELRGRASAKWKDCLERWRGMASDWSDN